MLKRLSGTRKIRQYWCGCRTGECSIGSALTHHLLSTRSLTHSLTHSFTHSLTHSSILSSHSPLIHHSFTSHSPLTHHLLITHTHSLSLTHQCSALTRSLNLSLTQSSLTHHSHTLSLTHSSVLSTSPALTDTSKSCR